MTAPAADNLPKHRQADHADFCSAHACCSWRHLLIAGLRIPAYLVPGPLAVLKAYLVNWKVIATQTGFTLSAAALGLTISTIFASTIALSFSMSRSFAQASLPVVIAFRSAPVAAVAPIIMLFLGRGINTSMVVVTIVSFFPLLVNLMRGLANADRNAAELLHVYGASRWQQLRYVRVPFALPFLFTGLRIAGANAILGACCGMDHRLPGSRQSVLKPANYVRPSSCGQRSGLGHPSRSACSGSPRRENGGCCWRN